MTQNPNQYVDNPRLFEKLVVQFEASDLTRADVISVLKKQGFNISSELEIPASTPAVSKSAPPTAGLAVDPTRDRHPLSESSEDTRIVAGGEDGTGRLLSITREIPMQEHLARDPTATLQLKNPQGDPEFLADIEGSFSKILGPAEPEVTKPGVTEPTEVEALAVADPTTVDLKKTPIEADERVTPESVKTYQQKVQDVVDAYLNTTGSEFFEDTGEMPYKADIDKVDLEIKGINDRLEQIGEEKIKPYFGKDDTWRKILAAIAAGAGAYASAMSGTPNYALQILNKAIDDDLEKQKLEIGFRSKSLEDQRILLTTKRLELLKMTEMTLNKSWRQAQDSRAKQKLGIMLLEVINAKDSEDQKLAQAFADALLKRDIEQQEGLVPNMGETGGVDGVSRLTGHARKMAIESAMEFNVIYGEAQRTVAQLLDITQEDKIKAMSTEALSETRTKFVTGITALKLLAAKKIYKFGAALTANEEKMLDEIIADTERTNIALNVTAARLHNFMAILERKRESIRDGGGFISVGQGGGAKASTRTPLPALPTLETGTSKE